MADYIEEIRVTFADLDALNHVNSAAYFTYAETTRCNWFLDVVGVADMQSLPFIVAAARAEYHHPTPAGRRLEVHMSVPRIGNKSWEFQYDVQDAKSETVHARLRTVQVAYDYQKQGSVPIPDDLHHKLSLLAPETVAPETASGT